MCPPTVVAPTAKARKSVSEVTVTAAPALRMADPKRASVVRRGAPSEETATLLKDCMMTNMSSIPGGEIKALSERRRGLVRACVWREKINL